MHSRDCGSSSGVFWIKEKREPASEYEICRICRGISYRRYPGFWRDHARQKKQSTRQKPKTAKGGGEGGEMKKHWLSPPENFTPVQKNMIKRARLRFGPIYPILNRHADGFTVADGQDGKLIFWFVDERQSSHLINQIPEDTEVIK
jgi:hypothetical protein